MAWAHDDSAKIKELESQISELQKRITILELSAGPEMKAATDMVSRLMQADKEYKDKKANLKSAAEYLGIKNWNIKQRDLKYGQKEFEVSVWLTNKTDKKISLVNGYVVFTDVAETTFRRVEFSGDLSLPPNQTLKYKAVEANIYEKDLEQFLDEDKKHLYSAHLDLEKIAFSDGEVVSIAPF